MKNAGEIPIWTGRAGRCRGWSSPKMNFRDVEGLLAERGVLVSSETTRQWCGKFGPDYARPLKRRRGRLGDTRFLDDVVITISGQRKDLWCAVDHDGVVLQSEHR